MIGAWALIVAGAGGVLVALAVALQQRIRRRGGQRLVANPPRIPTQTTIPTPPPAPGRHRRQNTGTELTATSFLRALHAEADAAQARMADAVTAEQAAVHADDPAPVR